jgi:stress response protein YsnF
MIPLTKVTVWKRPVAKEEIRIRKDVVEDAVSVTKKVRRKEVEVDDQTTGRMS